MVINSQINEYINYYVNLKKAPGFAILIRGNWGSGKSWLVNEHFKEYKKEQLIRVSLNGVTKFKEIEDLFFQQLHPILSSKGAKFAGRVFAGLVKASFKIDINRDGKEDGSISPTVPEAKLSELLNSVGDRILIFDDLERCGIPINNILGYINQFVECDGLKVIIIANEEEIIKINELSDQKSNPKYLLIKEKVIGRSFDVLPNYKEAIKIFVDEVEEVSVRRKIEIFRGEIEEIFLSSTYGNLRHLKYSLTDFSRFVTFLPDNIDKKEGLFDHLLKIFLSISIELKKGTITEDDIPQLFEISRQTESEKKDKINSVKSKYLIFSQYNNPIDKKIWKEYFKLGNISKDEVGISLENSSYYISDKTELWVKLWHTYDIEDSSFSELSLNVIDKLKNKEYIDPFVVLHVVGILLKLYKDKLISFSTNDILKYGKLNIKKISEDGKLSIPKHSEFPDSSYYGLGYTSRNTSEFKEFVIFIQEEIVKSRFEELKEKSVELLQIMRVSMNKFIQKIVFSNDGENEFYDVPILSFIKVEEFNKVFLSLKNSEKKLFGFRIETRYRNSHFNIELKEELEWLKNFRTLLYEDLGIKESSVSKILISEIIIPRIEKCINNLESI